MTVETRTLIELHDITGMEIECPECHFVAFFPAARQFKIGPQCPQCGHHLFDETTGHPSSQNKYPSIDSLQAVAAELRKMTNPERTDVHANIRLRINTEELPS